VLQNITHNTHHAHLSSKIKSDSWSDDELKTAVKKVSLIGIGTKGKMIVDYHSCRRFFHQINFQSIRTTPGELRGIYRLLSHVMYSFPSLVSASYKSL
ncbi:hypothetical protein M8C21_000165, partial [Ambrosia artemisiifolia]